MTRKFSFPSWIDQWTGPDSIESDFELSPVRLWQRAAGGRAWVVAEVAGAAALTDADFSEAARLAYAAIASQASQLGVPFPVRCWNAIPSIHQPSIDGDRYMSFNVGRHRAMSQWFGDELALHVPAATGVDSGDDSLRVAAMLSDTPGTPIENPRQVPAYLYSPRFGRLPPCFSRATRWRDELFIAGTAAVVGEESQHPQAFERQLAVTIDHLRLMLERGFARDDGGGRFTSFRVYLPEGTGQSARVQAVRAALVGEGEVDIEWISAELCRRDLLVEIEAVGTHNVCA